MSSRYKPVSAKSKCISCFGCNQLEVWKFMGTNTRDNFLYAEDRKLQHEYFIIISTLKEQEYKIFQWQDTDENGKSIFMADFFHSGKGSPVFGNSYIIRTESMAVKDRIVKLFRLFDVW